MFDNSLMKIDKDFYPVVVHTGNEEFANQFADDINERYGFRPEIRLMGPTIACHIGPGGVAFAFIAKEQRPY